MIDVEIDSVCPSIVRDIRNFEKCEPDIMRQDLHARCTGLRWVFEPEHGFSGEAMAEDTQIDLGLDLNFDKCVARIGIHGRSATVFPVESKALSGLQLDPVLDPPSELPSFIGQKTHNRVISISSTSLCKHILMRWATSQG